MRVDQKKAELGLAAVLFLLALYFWTLPFQENHIPYGDVDSSAHFTLGDYMREIDSAYIELPHYLSFTYYGDANDDRLWYPPQFHAGTAVAQITGGSRYLSLLIFVAITCSLGILSTYLLVRQLFGWLPAFLACFFLIFSTRDIMIYIFGLWPQVVGFAFVPASVYFYYRYTGSYKRGDKSVRYLVAAFALIATSMLMHPQSAMFSLGFVAVYSVVVWLKNKKPSFSIKHAAAGAAILVGLVVILAPMQLSGIIQGGSQELQVQNLDRLFHWYKTPEKNVGMPLSYFSYPEMNSGYWTVPFLAFGLLFLLFRRQDKDLLLISYLITLYIFIHLDVVGMGRTERFLQMEARVFYPIMAVGLVNLPSFFRLPRDVKVLAKYGLAAVFMVLVLAFSMPPAYSQLTEAYTGISRMTPAQIEAAEWLKENTPEEAFIGMNGILPQLNTINKWYRVLAQRAVVYESDLIIPPTNKYYDQLSYMAVDYTHLIALGAQGEEAIARMQQWEQETFTQEQLVYNNNNIRVYKLG
ncbi:hypothetical protein GF351_05750 [Candidatus Woesearchaeota archaeon]|nr:hypothetical protein [Candidatus Woesearchaeota archaeon]